MLPRGLYAFFFLNNTVLAVRRVLLDCFPHTDFTGVPSSEVEVLQVYGAQCACEQVKVLLGEIHRTIQGALQAG